MLLLALACAHEVDLVNGADVYAFACESCHGGDGAAGVQVNGVPASDLGVVVPGLDMARLVAVIEDGSGEMPRVTLEGHDTEDVAGWVLDTFGG